LTGTISFFSQAAMIKFVIISSKEYDCFMATQKFFGIKTLAFLQGLLYFLIIFLIAKS